MRALAAITMLLLLTGASFAQGSINIAPGDRQRTPDEREKDRQIEENYKKQMGKIPDQKASSDPWGAVRSTDTTQKSAPAAQRKPKQN